MSSRFPGKLEKKLDQRAETSALRQLRITQNLIDFSSNDYLGFGQSPEFFEAAGTLLSQWNLQRNSSSGSRLLSGNYELLETLERQISAFHKSPSALLFNSGYDANLGFFQCVPQRGDVILYDELCHASIRDGIGLSNAKAYKFRHNDPDHLAELLERHTHPETDVYVVTESVFSMDGDAPPLEEMVKIVRDNQAYFVIDEAHALGVFGENGEGLVQQFGLEDAFFARIMTFGKGLGCHGAAVLGSEKLRDYLINFARSLMYTTAMAPHAAAAISVAYRKLSEQPSELEALRANIAHFSQEKTRLGLKPLFVYSKSAIQCAVVPGNETVRNLATVLQREGYDVRPILSPTVPEGQERLRICLHAFHSQAEISGLLSCLSRELFS